MTSNLRVRQVRAGFTLVELLVVIAIIAILAGILFPVAATVQESARRGATMSGMMKIHQAVSAYELDNREYPEFLFGPAICRANGLPDPACSDFYTMKETAALVTGRYRFTDSEYLASRNARKIFSKSLYPEYIRDLDTYESKNNVVRTPNNRVGSVMRRTLLNPSTATYSPRSIITTVPQATPNYPDVVDALVVKELPFYAYDAFDASPKVNLNGTLDNTRLVPRYSRMWNQFQTNDTQANVMSPAQLQVYQRQLFWARPPAETVTTMTTHHVPKGKVLVLWQSGTAKVLDVSKMLQTSVDNTPNTGAQGDFQFWKLTN